MKNNNSKNSNKKFLKESTSDTSKHHKSYLGTRIPEGYFAKSKSSILNKIKLENEDSKFLKENNTNISQHHKTYLGTDVPEAYFEKSRTSILDKINEEVKEEKKQPKQQLVFYMRPNFKYIAAAVIVFMFSLTIWLQNSNNEVQFNEVSLEELALEDDVLIKSLLVEDSELDNFTETTLFNEVVIKAEITEQKMDDLILNSLILEDSLLDDYMNDKLVETIIL